MALPEFPHSEVREIDAWTNFHGTIPSRKVPIYCTPDVLGEAVGDAPRRLKRHGDAIKAVIDFCLANDKRLRVMGARWSLSRIIEPTDVVLDPGNLTVMLKVRDDWISAAYKQTRPGHVPIFTQCGSTISSINRRLGEIDLALQTSGASNGHRIAGCIATGTHGSALRVGAVHDTVLGIHLVVAPDKSYFIQPGTPVFTADVAGWLEKETGIPTENVADDRKLAAALVSLGSLGVVHGVVIETVPLYRLSRRNFALSTNDGRVWKAIEKLETADLHKDEARAPYHMGMVFNPYPIGKRPGAFVTLMWKELAAGLPPPVLPAIPDAASDLMGLVGTLSQALDPKGKTSALLAILADQLEGRYPTDPQTTVFPGQCFGPTSTPPGHGTGTEIAVDHQNATKAIQILLDVLSREGKLGNHLLGAMGLRFLPETKALLGMNIHPMTCTMELLSIRNEEVTELYRKCWQALEDAQIPFTCHWGQVNGLTEARLSNYFGARLDAWKAVRRELLPKDAQQKTFASPILKESGIDP